MSHGFNAVLGIKSTKTMPLQLVECGSSERRFKQYSIRHEHGRFIGTNQACSAAQRSPLLLRVVGKHQKVLVSSSEPDSLVPLAITSKKTK